MNTELSFGDDKSNGNSNPGGIACLRSWIYHVYIHTPCEHGAHNDTSRYRTLGPAYRGMFVDYTARAKGGLNFG